MPFFYTIIRNNKKEIIKKRERMNRIINKEMLKKYIEDNDLSIDDFIDLIVKRANMPITKADIKLIINKINNNSLEKTDETLIKALVSVLYELPEEKTIEDEIVEEENVEEENVEEENVEEEIVEEEIVEEENVEKDDVVENIEEEEDIVYHNEINKLEDIREVKKLHDGFNRIGVQKEDSLKLSKKSVCKECDELKKEKKGNSFLMTILISLVLFGGYIGYKEFNNKTDLIKEVKEKSLIIDEQKEEINTLKMNNKKLIKKEKRDKKNFEVMRREISKLSATKGVKKEKTQEVNKKIKKKLKKNINELKDNLNNYKEAIKKREKEQDEELKRFREAELKALEYEEKKVLDNPKYELFKHNKEFYEKEKDEYSVDEETKKEFLKSCVNGYEDRRVDYIKYCVCISDEIVRNKINFIDGLMLLGKNVKSNKFIGKFVENEEEMTYSEVLINKNTKHCYEDHMRETTKNTLILEY